MAWTNITRRIAGFCLLLVGLVALAPQGASAAQSLLVIKNDRGGHIQPRAERVAGLRQSGTRVEIRGTVCLSSCTMYLGAGDVCVSRATRFGFHGPSYGGKPMADDRFEYWSEVIAANYPEPLRGWFMDKGRYKLKGYHSISGERLIGLGVPECT